MSVTRTGPLQVGNVKFDWHGPQVTAAMRTAVAKGLFDAGQHLLEEATKRVPHDTGALERTGESHVDRAKLEVVISYGNEEEAPYAIYVHEAPESYNFQRGRERKWLENTFNIYGRRAYEVMVKPIADRFR